jgi:hypothetical protein
VGRREIVTPERLQEIREKREAYSWVRPTHKSSFHGVEPSSCRWADQAMAELIREVDRLTERLAIACGEWQGWLDAADSADWPHDSQGDRERLRRCRAVLRGDQ